MPGSFSASAPEADLLRRAQAFPEIEGAQRVGRAVGGVEEPPVRAVVGLAEAALDGLLDGERAAPQRLAGELDRAEAAARALGVLEQRDVDLGGEDLLQAAHEAPAGQRVLVGVEEGAAGGD